MALVQYETDQKRVENEHNKDRKQGVKEEGTKVPFHYLKKGKTILRVLPSPDGVWFKEYLEHTLNMAGKTVNFTCPRPYGQVCPLCDKGESLSEAGDASYRDFQPKYKYLFNVIVLSDPSGVTAAAGVKVLKAGVMIKKKLISLDRAFEEGYGNITGIADGFTLAIEREGETMKDTRYDIKPFRERTNLVDVLKAQGISTDSLTQYKLSEAIPSTRPMEELYAAIEGKKAVFGFPVVAASSTPVSANVSQPVATPAVTVATPVAPGITVTPVSVPVIPDPPTN